MGEFNFSGGAASILVLAALGGLVSFLSTSAGAVLSFGPWKRLGLSQVLSPIDFALGLMLSAVAFSLVGPAAKNSLGQPIMLLACSLGFAFGAALILTMKHFVSRSEMRATREHSSELLLALALIFHNFPEGLASGAALAGLEQVQATSILSSIALQNIPEGFLMVICLRAMGWSQGRAFLGGIASGAVELTGGVLAGLALEWVSWSLPVILMTAGGGMFMSVMLEIREKGNFRAQIIKPEFALGLISIPFLNILLA